MEKGRVWLWAKKTRKVYAVEMNTEYWLFLVLSGVVTAVLVYFVAVTYNM